MEIIQPLTRKVDPINAGRLRLAADVVYEMQFVRIHDGVRFCITTVALPPSVAKVLADTRGVPLDDIARQTTDNFFRLFTKVPRVSTAAA